MRIFDLSDLFEQIDRVEVRKLTRTNSDILHALDLVVEVFHEQYGLDKDDVEEEIHPMSFALGLYRNEDLIGAYIFREGDLDIDDLKEFCDIHIDEQKAASLLSGRGIEGVALAVRSEYKNRGYGKKLIEYSKKLNYDYVWGQQLELLGNLNDWLKRRTHLATYVSETGHKIHLTATRI